MAKGPKDLGNREDLYAEFVALGASVVATGEPPQTYSEAIALALYRKTEVYGMGRSSRTGRTRWKKAQQRAIREALAS